MDGKIEEITPKIIWELDKKYAEEGISFHARPFRAVMEIIGPSFSIGARVPHDPRIDWIERLYQELIPEVATTWPGEGTGIAASVDQVKKVIVPVVFGEGVITSEDALGFKSKEEWWRWCRADGAIAAESQYAFVDLMDFFFGMGSVDAKAHPAAYKLWQQAASNLEVIADSLVNCYRTNSILQPICMLAELSMKGALLKLGLTSEDLRLKFGHKLVELARELSRLAPHHEDALFIDACASFPDYIKSRYDESALNRLQIVRLALKAQFVAASSLRRVSGIDETLAIYASEWPGPRVM